MTLSILYNWLKNKYLTTLDIKLETMETSESSAIWIQNTDVNNRGELLDRDLGVWIKFIVVQEQNQMMNLIKAEVQNALSELSLLRPQMNLPEEHQDTSGTWSVSLFFLVHQTCDSTWRDAIQTLRSESGFSEELALDVLFFKEEKDLQSKLNIGNKLPLLLFSTRQLFRLDVDHLPSWLSADSEVQSMLLKFANQFTDISIQELAQRLVDTVLVNAEKEDKLLLPKEPKKINALGINNLRNIEELNLSFSNPREQVTTQIIFGPNGTGKSSIFEALSLSVCGASKGLEDFLDDKDVSTKHAENYIDTVLKSFDINEKSSIKPTVSLNGVTQLSALAKDSMDAKQRRFQANGTLLSQEDARAFVMDDSKTLGSKILSGYSSLAQNAQIYANQEYDSANRQRQEWLRRFNLNTNIKKSRTRWEKLCKHILDNDIPKGSLQIDSWLTVVVELIPEQSSRATALRENWVAHDSESGRSTVCDELASFGESGFEDKFESILYGWLYKREAALRDIREISLELHSHIDGLTLQRADIERDLKTWQQWKIHQNQLPPPNVDALIIEDNPSSLQKLNIKLSEIQKKGQQHRLQHDHLLQLQNDFITKWAINHPNQCPTCNMDHGNEGGITLVIEKISTALKKQIADEREQYIETQRAIKEIENHRTLQGQCPLSDIRRSELTALLGINAEKFNSIDVLLTEPNQVERLLHRIDTLIAVPQYSVLNDISSTSIQLGKKISVENARGQALWTLPEQWGKVKETLNEQAMAIVQKHIPQTLEAVWMELAMALTPARWNLIAEPHLDAEIQRGAERLKIVVGHSKNKVLARYLYNQAEQHTLGLAWFFTRYFALGRFQHALIAMDDPAQEMDQTTFRTFTRFLQILRRLHIRNKVPLSLLILLHQEDRALDAARATDHQLTALKWARKINSSGVKSSVEQVVLLNNSFKPPLPTKLRKTLAAVNI